VLRWDALMQSQEMQQLSVSHRAVFDVKPSGDDDTCLPISSPSRSQYCSSALLPPPVTHLTSCSRAFTLSGPRSEVSCARASCNAFPSSSDDRMEDDFLHQWCSGRATLHFGRRSFDAGKSQHLGCCSSCS
jgi:hypothetical protein